jgi:hypothetical protein
VVQEQIKLACKGKEAELKKSYTSMGVKDKYTEYWINDLLSQFKKNGGKRKIQGADNRGVEPMGERPC